jgi:type IV pilus assembly protein PilB
MRDQDLFLERALIDANLVTAQQMDEVRQFAVRENLGLVDALTQSEVLPSRQVALIQADLCEVPYVNLADFEPAFTNTTLVPRQIAERFSVYPLFSVDGVLTLAMEDPLNLEAADQVRQITKCEVDPVLVEQEPLRAVIARAYSLSHGGVSESTADDVVEIDVTDTTTSQPVIAAVNQLLADAVELGASDVHLNPDEHELHVRYRIDGVLHKKQGPSLSMHAAIVQRLKVMAHLDLTQTRRPQDGKFRFRHTGKPVDVRMSTIPTVCGENVVLRLLAQNIAVHDFHELGMPAEMASAFEEMINQPYGMALVTGPTGSGKTTTLYTALNKINDPSRNLMTIEDPVEIRLPYVRQVQVHTEIGMTFAASLRSILRQDPDVVLVGEIRDNETATIALQAALTGHLVLSTLHTNDAVGAVARLRDYGLPPFVLNSALLGVLAQRLVRRICSHCVEPDQVDDLMRHRFNLGSDVDGYQRGRGCGRCSQTGYRGRIGIYELFAMTDGIKRQIEDGASVDHIRRYAVEHDRMRLMWRDGLEKARLGQTTLQEVARAAFISELESTIKDDDLDLRRSA